MDERNDVLINESSTNNLIDSTSNNIKNLSHGRYLFGDYSIIYENLNFLNLIRDFVSTAENVIQIHQHISAIETLLTDITNFEEDILLKYDNFKNVIKESIKNFNEENGMKFNDVILIKHINNDWINEEIFTDQINESGEYHKKYFNENKSLIKSQIMEYRKNSFLLLQLWLFNRETSPFRLSEKTSSIFDISLIIENNKEIYQNIQEYQLIHENDNISKSSDKLQCSIYLNPLEKFRNGKIKLMDIFTVPIFIPVGFKKSISNKIKNSFRLVTNNHEDNNREPEYISITNFFIINIHKELNNIILVISNDPSQVNQKIIKIIFDIEWNPLSADLLDTDKINQDEKKPSVYYKVNGKLQKEMNIFNEFHKFIDMKLMLSLKQSLTNLIETCTTNENILKCGQIAKLEFINQKHIILEQKNNELVYHADKVIDLLESTACLLAPIVSNIKEKSPIKNELLIRYEQDDKPRKEIVIKIDELVKQLSCSGEGKNIITFMNLSTLS